jgi:predicted dehydrogenase
MRVWASEGYLAADFMTKKLTMQQPTESLRRHGLQLSRLSDGERTRLKDELFTRYVQTCEVDCTRKTDQLTQELLDFTQSVRDRKSPRVTGEDGRAALALAERILESVRSHRWSGGLNGKVGPEEWPEPLGKLFEIEERRAA